MESMQMAKREEHILGSPVINGAGREKETQAAGRTNSERNKEDGVGRVS